MKKYLGLLVISLLSLPISANALTGSVDIECAKNELKTNESTTCTIKGKSDADVTGLSMKLSASSNLVLGQLSVDKNVWQGDGTDGFITLYTDTNKTGDFVIGTFTVTSKSEGSNDIQLNEIIFSDKDFNEVKLTSVKETVKIVTSSSVVENKNDVTVDTNKNENENVNNETVVENPATGIVLSIGALGLVFIGAVIFVITKKKNYFCKL